MGIVVVYLATTVGAYEMQTSDRSLSEACHRVTSSYL